MRQYFRPYTLTRLTAAPQTKETFVLKDTSGTALPSNYVSVQVSGDGAANGGLFRATIKPQGTTIPAANFASPEDQMTDTASGIPSVYFSSSNPAEFLLSDKDRASEIDVQAVYTGGNAFYAVTYGQVAIANNIRDEDRPKGT